MIQEINTALGTFGASVEITQSMKRWRLEMVETHTSIEGDTIDDIAFNHYGHHRGTTELVLDANRGLADQPLSLPDGLEIDLPDLPEEEPIQTVKLYD